MLIFNRPWNESQPAIWIPDFRQRKLHKGPLIYPRKYRGKYFNWSCPPLRGGGTPSFLMAPATSFILRPVDAAPVHPSLPHTLPTPRVPARCAPLLPLGLPPRSASQALRPSPQRPPSRLLSLLCCCAWRIALCAYRCPNHHLFDALCSEAAFLSPAFRANLRSG